MIKQLLIIKVVTKSYLDLFHRENERSRRDLGLGFYNESTDLVKNNQDNIFSDNKGTNIDSISVNKILTLNEVFSNEKYVDDELDKNTLLRLNQTLANYLKVSV